MDIFHVVWQLIWGQKLNSMNKTIRAEKCCLKPFALLLLYFWVRSSVNANNGIKVQWYDISSGQTLSRLHLSENHGALTAVEPQITEPLGCRDISPYYNTSQSLLYFFPSLFSSTVPFLQIFTLNHSLRILALYSLLSLVQSLSFSLSLSINGQF